MFAWFPLVRKLHRLTIYLYLESQYLMFGLNSKRGARAQSLLKRYIAYCMKNKPELVEKLIPKYPVGCKRVVINSDFYPALDRENVDLVTTGIKKITENAIELKDGKSIEVDIIICATGFDIQESFYSPNIFHKNGTPQRSVFGESPKAYLGSSISGLPNYFTLLGPSSILGHNSVLVMIESQLGHIIKLIKYMRDNGMAQVEVKQDVVDKYIKMNNDNMKTKVWAADFNSWYKNSQGELYVLWSMSSLTFIWKCFRANNRDYIFIKW
eukprot:NODE_4798_length_1112_cov_39.421638_g4258_i0.p1 GENE.NODE_4798_length_1112_cov_39.421638_g4258_i0~~NODE_4798_length_1112_cov_39.421638_g4258_i0.p1  ORF type:complete len:268 (+),score=29.07 NODE_4798_length_1112_cov_39.421638_g4258_i0:166-969(+)